VPLFKKGERRAAKAGRRAGTPNKHTAEMRDIIENVFERLGGEEALIAWCRKDDINLRIFYTRMWIATMPKVIHGAIEHTVHHEHEIISQAVAEMSDDEVREELKRHGLPPTLFDLEPWNKINKPSIEAKAIEGNGLDSDEPGDVLNGS
jgi:hypothetical protein